MAQDVPVSSIADGLAEAVCAALEDCLGAQKLSALFQREDCRARIGGSLAQDDLAKLPEEVAAGRVSFDPERLEACHRDTRALGCAIQTERLPDSCQRAIAGQVALGDACNIGSDCSGAAFCSSGACPRTCAARAARGGGCRRDEECENGLFCNSGSCAAPAALGAACSGNSGGVCAFGASCVGSNSSAAGVCRSNSEIQVGALGAACTPGGALCEEGLNCAFDGVAGFNCQTAVAAGASCHLALPGQCPTDQYCDAPDVMTAGRCVALPGDGSPCVLSDECAPRHLCVVENSQNVCRRFGDLGDACKVDGLCRSGYCEAGKCALRPVCP